MSGTLFIGIDPGASGAIALIWPDGKAEAHAWEGKDEARDFLESLVKADAFDRVVVALEQVGGFMRVGGENRAAAHTMFVFGENFGFWQGVVMANRIPLHLVRPQLWQRSIAGAAKAKGAEKKRVLKNHAAMLFPNLKPTLKTADALCIAEWARQNLNQ